MTARDDAIKEADRIITRTGYLSIEKIAVAVVDAVEPIIRADEMERIRAAYHLEERVAGDRAARGWGTQ